MQDQNIMFQISAHSSSKESPRKERYIQYTLSISLFLYALACPISTSATYFPLFAAVISALFIWSNMQNRFLFLNQTKGLFILLLLLVVWQCITIFLNRNEVILAPIERSLKLLPIFMLSGLPCDENWKQNIAKNAVLLLFFVTSFIVLLGIYQDIAGIFYTFPLQPFSGGRLIGFFKHHIPAGGFFSVLTMLSASLLLFWRTSVRMQIILGMLFFILLSGTLLSLSRTYFISLLITFPLLLFRKSLKIAALGMIALFLFISITLVSLPSIRNRAFSIFDLKYNPSNIERLYLWKVARDMIQEHPVSGIGYKQWHKKVSEYSSKYSEEWTFSPASLYHAHNVYLHVTAETGLVGLFFFLTFWLYLLYLTFHNASIYSNNSFVMALNLGTSYALINLLIGGLFDENFGVHPTIFLMSFIISLSFFVTNPKEIFNKNKAKSYVRGIDV